MTDQHLNDTMLRGLRDAERSWKLSILASHTVRVALARDLYKHQMFSLNQLAKICRTSVPTLSRRFRANAGGGRFEPEALAHLIAIRIRVIEGRDVSPELIRSAEEAGVSINTIATLTGASFSVLYKRRDTDFPLKTAC